MSDDERFGFSLALVEGDIIFANGELSQVHGKRNLLQALELAVLTPFGSDIFNVTYGLDLEAALTRPLGLRMVKELIKLNLVRTLGSDPRVRDIREVLFEDDPAYLARHPELSAPELREHRRRRAWAVDVVLELADGEAETLSIDLGV